MDARLASAIGANHFGDDYIKKWGAFAGEAVERGDGKGRDLDYGAFGNAVLAHMYDHDTLQTVLRFGRDGGGATVYVHTNTLPEWVPVVVAGGVIRPHCDGMAEVLAALDGHDCCTTADLAAEVAISARQVRTHLTTLHDHGLLARHREGRGYIWEPTALDQAGAYGLVAFESDDSL